MVEHKVQQARYVTALYLLRDRLTSMLGAGEPNGNPCPRESAQRDEILAELDTVLASSSFVAASRRARLLRYLVERALAGEGESVNEYAIGVDVFGKSSSFDPRMEAGVRTEVGRLRRKLKDYYEGEGSRGRIVIEFPVRSYALSFRLRSLDPVPTEADFTDAAVALPATRRWRTATFATIVALCVATGGLAVWKIRGSAKEPIHSLVVLPFQDQSPAHDSEYLADGLTDELTNDFAVWKELRVVARTSAYQYKGKGVDVRKIGHER